MKEQFEHVNFRKKSLDLIGECNRIINNYQQQGYDLTLRQLYYQLVSQTIIANTDKQYKSLGELVGKARMAGLIDWSAIVDRTRGISSPSKWSSPESILDAVASQYHLDYWKGQDTVVEVWVEKDALRGVIAQAARTVDSPNFSCRGYSSLTEMYNAGKRIYWNAQDGKRTIILHLGDHDPSGIDMTRDIKERLETFSGLEEGHDFEVNRIALNYDQVQLYNPPPNPAKLTDSRVDGYIARYGSSSWELDALDPTVLSDLIFQETMRYVDLPKWNQRKMQEEEEKKQLQAITDNYDSVVDFLDNGAENGSN